MSENPNPQYQQCSHRLYCEKYKPNICYKNIQEVCLKGLEYDLEVETLSILFKKARKEAPK